MRDKVRATEGQTQPYKSQAAKEHVVSNYPKRKSLHHAEHTLPCTCGAARGRSKTPWPTFQLQNSGLLGLFTNDKRR